MVAVSYHVILETVNVHGSGYMACRLRVGLTPDLGRAGALTMFVCQRSASSRQTHKHFWRPSRIETALLVYNIHLQWGKCW